MADHDLGKEFPKGEVEGNMLCREEDGILEYGRPIDKRSEVLCRDEFYIIYLFLQILRFDNNMRGPIVEEMLENFPAVILCDEVL